MQSGIHSYVNILDIPAYVNVKVRGCFLWNFR